MGSTRKIRYVVRLVMPESGYDSGSEWRVGARYGASGYGRPTVENLKRYIKHYNASLRPGGVNSHIGRRGRAVGGTIVDQGRGNRVVAEWRAPMFTTDESEFEPLYRERE